MNELDQELHKNIHQFMMNTHPENIFSGRVKVFDYVENKLSITVAGVGLDIGCGSGYASIWLAKNKPVKKIYAQEASHAAVEQLLPRNISHHKVEAIVEPLLGSFDALPFRQEIDFVVSFGALHHSICLYSTMKSISKALKDGGYLIAQEPVMPNTTSNQDYINKYNIIENMFGMKIRNGDRNDNFFREAEYVTAAAFCGLDLVLYDDFSELEKSSVVNKILKKLRGIPAAIFRKIKSIFKSEITVTSQRSVRELPDGDLEYTKKVMRKIMVFKKKDTEYIPHVWRGLGG